MSESAFLRLACANKVSHKRAALLIFKSEFIEGVLRARTPKLGVYFLLRMIDFASRHIDDSGGNVEILGEQNTS